MQLLNPIWLTALAALAVPVLIHLWNIRPGKTLKVGSIQWFEEASPANSRSLKLQDAVLLLLRCLLLALMAFLLATPVWERFITVKKAKGWVLVPAQYLRYVQTKYRTQLDSLNSEGYEYHLLQPGFKEIDSLATQYKSVPDTANYWQLIKQLPQRIPELVPVHLFTPNNINHFQGEKPATPLNITWHTFSQADSVKTWIAGTWLTPSGGFRVVQGMVQPSGISYQYFNINSDGANSPFNISINNGKPLISLRSNAAINIEADTSTTRISIYTGQNITDAGYLEAALKAVEKFSQRKMQVRVYRQLAAIPQTGDWLFWLSDEPLKKTAALNIFYYATGKKEATLSWLENGEAQSGKKPALHQVIEAKTATGEALWTDGYGNTILSKVPAGKSVFYPFHTRLNPAATSLVWDERFPLWLLKLVAKPLIEPPADTRILDQKQISPVKITGEAKSEISPKKQFSITNYLWLALALLFFTERWLTYCKQTQPANG